VLAPGGRQRLIEGRVGRAWRGSGRRRRLIEGQGREERRAFLPGRDRSRLREGRTAPSGDHNFRYAAVAAVEWEEMPPGGAQLPSRRRNCGRMGRNAPRRAQPPFRPMQPCPRRKHMPPTGRRPFNAPLPLPRHRPARRGGLPPTPLAQPHRLQRLTPTPWNNSSSVAAMSVRDATSAAGGCWRPCSPRP
jgi:hypothetical protein